MEQGFEHKQAVSGANILNHYMVLPLRKRPDCSSDLACVRAPFCRCGFRYPHYFDHPLLDEFQFLFIIHKPTELPQKNPAVQTACVQYYTMSVSLWTTYWVSHTDCCLLTDLQTMKSPILLTCAIKSSLFQPFLKQHVLDTETGLYIYLGQGLANCCPQALSGYLFLYIKFYQNTATLIHLHACCGWLLSLQRQSRQLWQRPQGLQSLKGCLSGFLQKKLADSSSRPLTELVRVNL